MISRLLSPTSEEHGFLGHDVVFFHGKSGNPIVLDYAEYKRIQGQWKQYVQKFPGIFNVVRDNRHKTCTSPFNEEEVDRVVEECMAHVK